jgi:hypothetical protein
MIQIASFMAKFKFAEYVEVAAFALVVHSKHLAGYGLAFGQERTLVA